MTSLRALIEGKQRRKTNLYIQVGDPVAAASEVETFRAALRVHQEALKGREATEEDAAREENLRGQLQAALDRQAAVNVAVELQSLPDDEWDAMFGDLEPDAQGELDLTAIQAPLLAASCIDPELQDAGWWAEQLKRPEWTDGDRGAISQKLLELNCYAPSGAPGKG